MRAAFFGTAVLAMTLLALSTSRASEPLESPWLPQQLIAPTTNDPGYFVDPYPVYVASETGAHPDARWITGTTRQLLTCQGVAPAQCYQASPLEVDTGLLKAQANQAGMKLGVYDNANAYRDDQGHWQMAFTVYVSNPSATGPDSHWTVIGHAHPALDGTDVPANWVADGVIIGSLSKAARGNYDGKYFKDNGQLFLVYSKRLKEPDAYANPPTGAQDGIVAQALIAPDRVKHSGPVLLLAPADKGAGFRSELFHPDEPNDRFKLVETGNITRIGNTYVMAYSTGAYNRPAYKSGVAFSNTFLPAPGKMYRKVLMKDDAGVWGNPGHLEVHYLLQGAKANWPNYIGDKILAPGVPSIVSTGRNTWSLFFAGYSIDDAPKVAGTNDFSGSHRRPYVLPLDVNIPINASVDAASDEQLMDWIRPRTRPGN